MALDGMEWSSVKSEAIRASMTEDEDALSYLLPFLRFHSRWSELTAEDLTYAYKDKPLVSDSGYLMQTGVVPADTQSELTPEQLIDYTLPATAMDYLDRMRALCAERGIELILVKAPTNFWRYHWYDEWDQQITAYAADHDLAYYNFMNHTEAIGLDMSVDTYDAGIHLNVYGAEKLTRYFGEILASSHEIPDRRTDAAASAVWNRRMEAYANRKAAMESQTQP